MGSMFLNHSFKDLGTQHSLHRGKSNLIDMFSLLTFVINMYFHFILNFILHIAVLEKQCWHVRKDEQA